MQTTTTKWKLPRHDFVVWDSLKFGESEERQDKSRKVRRKKFIFKSVILVNVLVQENHERVHVGVTSFALGNFSYPLNSMPKCPSY